MTLPAAFAARVNALLSGLAGFATLAAATALVGLVGVEGWQVFARYVLNASPGWTDPLALLLMSTAMMFGAAAAVRSLSHFGFFILVESVGPAAQRVLRALSQLITVFIGLLLALWGGELMIDGWGIPMAGASLPQSAPYLPICMGGFLMFLFGLEQLVAPPPSSAPH